MTEAIKDGYVNVGNVVIYTLRVYNEGEIDGFATEIADYLPEGLGFLVNHTTNIDNYWLIPTDCKTTPYYQGGYMYTKFGGESSTYPFLAGVFACACQNNNIFFTRANWQDELFQIMQETANKNDTGQKIINPLGIRERVTQIAREMETNLTKRENRYE